MLQVVGQEKQQRGAWEGSGGSTDVSTYWPLDNISESTVVAYLAKGTIEVLADLDAPDCTRFRGRLAMHAASCTPCGAV